MIAFLLQNIILFIINLVPFHSCQSAGCRIPPTFLPLSMDLVAVHSVAPVQRAQVALDGQFAIHHGVLRHHVWLVEVIGVLHVCPAQACRTRAKSTVSKQSRSHPPQSAAHGDCVLSNAESIRQTERGGPAKATLFNTTTA